MNVAYDVTPVISGRTGIARYANELGVALERRGVALRRFAVGRRSFPLPADAKHLPVPARVISAWWRRVSWPPVELLVGEAELVHATGLLRPATRLPLVMTIHDLAALHYPDLHPPRQVQQLRSQLGALPSAAAIVAVSAATADDLLQLGVPAHRVIVAPLGLSSLPEPAPAPEGLGRGYLLTVGETSARKRYPVLLEALARLDADVRLVMAGPEAGDEPLIRALIAQLELGGRVVRLGTVNDALLARLYRDASVLCFPSCYEGFGLPVLEAMDAGLAVMASDIPTTRELAGDAALYVAGDGPQAWAQALEAVCADADLRRRLSQAGRARAQSFTWDRTAAATLKAYELALEAAG